MTRSHAGSVWQIIDSVSYIAASIDMHTETRNVAYRPTAQNQ